MDVNINVNINPSLIIGKEFNPYTSVYLKVGGIFTNVDFAYTVEHENPPFMAMDRSSFKSKRVFPKHSAWLKGVSGGLGVMFAQGNWIWALEYNLTWAQKTTIREYGKPADAWEEGKKYKITDQDPHIRGYMYAYMDHRLMLRLMYMKRL